MHVALDERFAVAILVLATGLMAPGPVRGVQRMQASHGVDPGETGRPARSGEELYLAACASCHGADGAGAARPHVGFDLPLPDFTDCDFASREPDADWIGVAYEGGPTRGFSRLMPAFGTALTVAELERIVAHVRTFCTEAAWPPGELNLPRPMITEKAYPEDEAVFTLSVDTEGTDRIEAEVTYEQRFGARSQFELVVPLIWEEQIPVEAGPDGERRWTSSVGDVAVGIKRALWHSLGKGSIVSVTGEVILPTGDEDRGFGSGTPIFEPFVSYGQILPAGLFLHGQTGLELPFDDERKTEEAFARMALGRTFVQGRWGRAWSPMVEILAARELTGGADVHWDAVPQLQVTLNRRQHVMLDIALRVPLDDTDVRESTAYVYVLWDWFDGGLFAGW